MSLNIRALLLVVFPALLVALGCASTDSVPEEAALEPAAIDDPKDSHESLGSVSLNPVYFETDRAQLRPEARDALKHHAKTILDHPEWGVVTIEGHRNGGPIGRYGSVSLGSSAQGSIRNPRFGGRRVP